MDGQAASPTGWAEEVAVAAGSTGPEGGSDVLRADLARYYDQDAATRAERPLLAERIRRRDQFVQRLVDEGRTQVVEIGLGPGLDAAALASSGLDVRGVDLSREHVRLARERGIDAVVAPAQDLPYDDSSFDALWCASVLMHLPDDDLDAALRESGRVLRPGGLAVFGMWGGAGTAGYLEGDPFDPPRWFSWRTDDAMRAAIAAHATVESFESGWVDPGHYQWCVARFGSAGA